MMFDLIICTYLVGVVCVALLGGLIVGYRAEVGIIALGWPIVVGSFVAVAPVVGFVALGAFIRSRLQSPDELEGVK